MPLLQALQLSKSIRDQPILRNISFSLEAGEKLVIAGVTGSGKSSLLKIIAGLMQTDGGEARFRGSRILGPTEKLMAGHPSIAYLSQHFELRNNYRVEELLEMANKMPEEKYGAIIEVCRIGHLLKRRTDQLSGGEKQRIATARLLMGEPELLLLDEPYSNLDLAHRQVMKDMIRDISNSEHITCILVSHDPADTLPWADRMLVLNNGQWIQEGSPEKIYREPVDEYVAGLLGPFTTFGLEEAMAGGLTDRAWNRNPLLVRPENFQVVDPGQGASAVVREVRFAGMFFEIQAIWANRLVTIHTTSRPSYTAGDTIHLKLDTGQE
jgi:ABC-type Fe3+/spermidine/putrescine transport system ATPase subunit